MVLDMSKYHEEFENYLKKYVEENKDNVPTLHIITDGKDERCKTYMKSKVNMCKKIGINCVIDIVKTEKEMLDLCENIWSTYDVAICQLPIAKELEDVYKSEAESIDVDGMFGGNNIFNNYGLDIIPATAKGIMRYLKYEYKEKLRGKNIVLVGMGDLCNKPLMILFANQGATVMTFNTSTDENLKLEMLKNADIVVCAGGKKGTVKTSQLSDNKKVLVFNVGIVFDSNGKLDTELEIDVEKNNIDYTPRIKGVGVSTVLCLLDNVCRMTTYCNISKDIDKIIKEEGGNK